MDLAYTVDSAGVITHVEEPAWSLSARAADTHQLTASAVVGRRLADFISSPEVAAAYRLFHQALLQRVVSEVCFQCECDGPAVRRALQLRIQRDEGPAGPLLRYRSTILSETPRDLIPLDLRERQPGDDALLRMCSFCKRVRLPMGGEESPWLPLDLYHAELGAVRTAVSHGICAPCRERIIDPVLEKMQQERGS